MSDKLFDGRTQLIWVHSSIDDMTNLSPNAMRVYMHLVRRADKSGVAWPSYQKIGDHCFSSVSDKPATRKTFARNAIDELIEAQLIRKEERIRDDGGQSSNAYTLVNPSMGVLLSTGGAYKGRGHADIDTPRAYQAPEDNTNEGISNEGTPFKVDAAPVAQTPQQEMFGAICEAIGWDHHVISDKNKGQVAQAVKVLNKAGYTVDDIRRFMMEVWFHDWRWEKKQQYPTLSQLREEIGKIRSIVPAAAPAKKTKSMESWERLGEQLRTGQ
jgi:hypothetical protein